MLFSSWAGDLFESLDLCLLPVKPIARRRVFFLWMGYSQESKSNSASTGRRKLCGVERWIASSLFWRFVEKCYKQKLEMEAFHYQHAEKYSHAIETIVYPPQYFKVKPLMPVTQYLRNKLTLHGQELTILYQARVSTKAPGLPDMDGSIDLLGV